MASLHHHNPTLESFIAPQDHNDMKGTNTKEMNLIVNIMWIVLLCGLIASFGVFQVLRFAIQRRRMSSHEVSNQASQVSTGLKKSTVCQMSTRMFGSEVKICIAECTICLEEFVDGQSVRVLPHCGHEFHVECIDKWFESHASCPNCRNCLLEHHVASHVVVPQSVVDNTGDNNV